MSEIVSRQFGSVRAEIETVDGSAHCFLFVESPDGSRYGGSLQRTQYEGGIPYDGGGSEDGPEVFRVRQAVMEQIEDWARAYGY